MYYDMIHIKLPEEPTASIFSGVCAWVCPCAKYGVVYIHNMTYSPGAR
jgi:hypothetical protein